MLSEGVRALTQRERAASRPSIWFSAMLAAHEASTSALLFAPSRRHFCGQHSGCPNPSLSGNLPLLSLFLPLPSSPSSGLLSLFSCAPLAFLSCRRSSHGHVLFKGTTAKHPLRLLVRRNRTVGCFCAVGFELLLLPRRGVCHESTLLIIFCENF